MGNLIVRLLIFSVVFGGCFAFILKAHLGGEIGRYTSYFYVYISAVICATFTYNLEDPE